jgi:hypothetical protein
MMNTWWWWWWWWWRWRWSHDDEKNHLKKIKKIKVWWQGWWSHDYSCVSHLIKSVPAIADYYWSVKNFHFFLCRLMQEKQLVNSDWVLMVKLCSPLHLCLIRALCLIKTKFRLNYVYLCLIMLLCWHLKLLASTIAILC